MKSVVALAVLVAFGQAHAILPKQAEPVKKTKETTAKGKQNTAPNALDKKAADCDEKAKKPVEITPESISLSGTTGCSLDEVKP